MSLDHAELARLAGDIASSSAELAPTEKQRALIAAIPAELAAAHATIARLEQRLRAHERFARVADRQLQQARSDLADRAALPFSTTDLDLEHVAAARRELLQAIDRAERGEQIIEAVLRFVALGSVLAA